MRWISFLGGVIVGGFVCLILGGIIGIMLGHDFGYHNIYDRICGYDYVLEVKDEAERTAVCEYLRSL